MKNKYNHNYFVRLKQHKGEYFYLLILSFYLRFHSFTDLEGIDPETLRTADIVRDRLCEDLYNYYAFEIKCENYAQRLYKLSHLVTALDVSSFFSHFIKFISESSGKKE